MKPTYYAVFMGYIVTANADGSIPLNSQMICALSGNDAANWNLVQKICELANETTRADARRAGAE